MTRQEQAALLLRQIQRPNPMFGFYLKQRERVLWQAVYICQSDPFAEMRLFNRNALSGW